MIGGAITVKWNQSDAEVLLFIINAINIIIVIRQRMSCMVIYYAY